MWKDKETHLQKKKKKKTCKVSEKEAMKAIWKENVRFEQTQKKQSKKNL